MAQLHAQLSDFLSERAHGADEDVHMLTSVVDSVIAAYSEPGEIVFDPFAGFGTSLSRAHRHGRVALGIELLPERVAHIEEKTPGVTVIEGDSRELLRLVQSHLRSSAPGRVALVLTSPPYMTKRFHEADPLTAYEQPGGDYSRYLTELDDVARQCAALTKPGGFVVWNVADIDSAGEITPLIHDCSDVLARHFTHRETIEIVWDQYPHDLVRDALLVFQAVPENENRDESRDENRD